jgi:DNA polymerase III subunit gamma/tau
VSYQVFARKYRPKTFDDVLGQDHVVRTLRNAISQSRLAHAYLFVGPRGTGKTSTARIFAKALNCKGGPSADFDPDEELCREIAEGRSLDVLEIDGASNNGVEQVRELRDNVRFAPARCRFKIYYIDEVHMLTAAAFNALLKTLEEPPEHVKFIFATTEPNKILPTIISRCQRFDLRRISTQVIAEHLLHIAKLEGVDLDVKAAYAIGRGAEGGMRDAQSMLDQLVAFCGNRILEENVLEIFGFTAGETVAVLAGCLLTSDTVGALRVVHDQSEGGKDLGRLLGDLIQYIRTLLVYQADPEAALEDLSPELAQMVAEQAVLGTTDQLLRMVDGLAEVDARMRWASNKRLHFELGVIQAVQHFNEVSLDDVITALDQGGVAGGLSRAGAGRPPEAAVKRAAAVPARPAAVVRGAEPAAATREQVSGRVEREEEMDSSPRLSLRERIAQEEAAERAAVPAVATQAAPPAATPVVPEVRPAVVEQKSVEPTPPLSNEAFWQRLLGLVNQRRPLTLHWIQVATLIGIEGSVVTIGFPVSEESSRDNLMRPSAKGFLEEVASELLGRSATLKLVVDAGLAVPAASEMTFGFVDEVAAPAEAEATPSNAAEAVGENVEGSPVADFYDDPVIKRAVERFRMILVES